MEFCSSIVYYGVLEPSKTELEESKKVNKSPVFASDVRSSYIDKQASVMTIDLSELMISDELKILEVGEKKVGIFSTQSYLVKKEVTSRVQKLKEEGANVIICIAPRSNMLATYDGVSAILCTKEMSPSETSEGHIEDTFVFRSPNKFSVGVISISDTNTIIQKVFAPKEVKVN